MINFFQEYLKLDTSSSKPCYDDVIALFVAQAEQDGFAYDIVPLGNAYKALVIRCPGSDSSLPALVMTQHMDVVPVADAASWKFDPFGGIVDNGTIYGRGTQDMKGVGVAHYFGLRRFLTEDGKLKRTVYLALLPDEEHGGYEGAGRFVELPYFKKMNIGYVLDEGTPSGNAEVVNIKVSERKPIQIAFTSRGTMAHASRIGITNAAHELIAFLRNLVRFQDCQQLNVLGQTPGLLLSMNVTSLNFGTMKDGAVALNVIADVAIATVDIRVPPTICLQDIIRYLEKFLARYPSITYKVESTVQERSFDQVYRNAFYQAVERGIEARGLNAHVFHAEESSDLRFYLEKGKIGFGVTPFTCKENLHGTNESITIKDLEMGRDVFCAIIKDFCT